MADDRDTRLDVEVECYAGGRADEAPRRFLIGGRNVDISEILDRWFGPDHRYFKVRGGDGCVYILRHDERLDVWEMTMMDAATGQSPLGM